MAKYRITKDGTNSGDQPAGTIVYDLAGDDFGVAADDTRRKKVEHKSVTLSPHGHMPFFTIVAADLEVIP